MYKVFNNSLRKFVIEAGGKTMTLAPGKFANVPEEFEEDVTFRVAVAGGDLKIYDDVKAAEKLIKDHEAKTLEEPKEVVTVENADKAAKTPKGKAAK